ncbi:hypothetical protein [Saccharopolyspora gregorii]|uniref:hypothetical protein n=1 Tax=Saccharopolyspora gregorii TaxID=33914 RepID=UPI0031EF4E39
MSSQECLLDLDDRLQAYDSWRTAADLEELRLELDVPKLHAVGIGEATRVLTTYAQRYRIRWAGWCSTAGWTRSWTRWPSPGRSAGRGADLRRVRRRLRRPGFLPAGSRSAPHRAGTGAADAGDVAACRRRPVERGQDRAGAAARPGRTGALAAAGIGAGRGELRGRGADQRARRPAGAGDGAIPRGSTAT